MDTQTIIVISFKTLYGVWPQWLLSLDKYYLLFINIIERGNNETIISVMKNTQDTRMIGLVTRNYLFWPFGEQIIRILTCCSCSIHDNNCLQDSCTYGTKRVDNTVVLLLFWEILLTILLASDVIIQRCTPKLPNLVVAFNYTTTTQVLNSS